MKKIHTLLLLVLLFSVTAYAQTGWITKPLDNKASVKFPSEPQKATRNGIDTYTFKAKDSVTYTAALIDYKIVANLDSAALAPMKDSQQFADQMKMGMASKRSNYTFGEVTIGEWKGNTTYNLSATENTRKDTLLMRMILIGSKMYALSCLVPAGTDPKNGEAFLGSVELLK